MFNVIFVLMVAGNIMGTVGMQGGPVDQATCEQVTRDPENIQFVHDMVKEQTGEDFEVEGVCMPADESEGDTK